MVFRVLIALALAGTLTFFAKAEPAVTWMLGDLPPFHIGGGPFAEQGIKDQQQRFLADNLPQFTHQKVVASASRIWYDVEHRDGVCMIGISRNTDRDKLVIFSQRAEKRRNIQALVVKRANAGRFLPFADPEGLDLMRLATSDSLRGAYIAAHIYSVPIRQFLNDIDRRSQLDQVPAMPALFGLLGGDRVDFVFASSLEAAFFAEGQPYVAIWIKNTDRMEDNYVACSIGPTGKAVIAAIDRLFLDEAKWRAFTEPGQQWQAAHPSVEFVGPRPVAP